MDIINNKRIINVDCIWHNQETLFLGYASDINSVELHFIIEPELLKKTENNFTYKIVFNRGTIDETVKDDVTWSATNGLSYVVPPAITHFSNNNAIQGHQGCLQLFVMKGGNGSAATLVASSRKIPYIIADSLDLSATTVEDLGNTLWSAVQQAVAKIEALHFDKVSGTNALTNDDSYVPSSKLMSSLLSAKVKMATVILNGSTDDYPNIDSATKNDTLYRVLLDSTYLSPYGYALFCGKTTYPSAQILFQDQGEIEIRTGRRVNGTFTWDASGWKKILINSDVPTINRVSEWSDKKHISFGDSIAWYDGQPYQWGTHQGETAKGYQTVLSETLGVLYTRSSDNKGKSGFTVAKNYEGTHTGVDSIVDVITNSQSQYYANVNYSNYHICTILGGTNDFRRHTPLGSIGAIGDTSFDADTFYGAYRKIIEHILGQNASIKLILITPPQRDPNPNWSSYESTYDVNKVNNVGCRLVDYVNAVKRLGEMYSLPVCDLYSCSGITKATLSEYTIDGLHPNDKGFERIGKLLAGLLQSGGNS